jgi:hypothetical protein
MVIARNSAALDNALSNWTEAYDDQTGKDYAALVKAIEKGQ